MSGLVDAIDVEISDREAHRATLTGEIEHVDAQLQQLRDMHQAATLLAAGGAAEDPQPAEPSRNGAKPGGRQLPGRNGGKAPARKPRKPPLPSATRTAGSAPSGSSSRAQRSSSTGSEGGGSKRAAVLAFVQERGKTTVAEVADDLYITRGAASVHLRGLLADEQILAEGSTTNRVYLAVGEPGPPPSTDPPVDAPAEAATPPDAGGGSADVDPDSTTGRVLAALKTANDAWRTSEVAYQASKGGDTITKQDAERALLNLLATGDVARFTAHGGVSTWRAAE